PWRRMISIIPALSGGPPDKAGMMDIMRRHGLTPAAPPPS
ncbi:cupin domain-containing protein, partial [Mesorhizobium sp. M7A.F.Ca.CA.001.13.1.1]